MSNVLQVSLVQCDLKWKDPAYNCDKIAEMAGHLATSDLIVLPEMFATGFIMDPDQTDLGHRESVAFMHDLAQSTQAIVCGSLAVEASKRYYNRFFAVSPTEVLATYDKKHLFALATEHHRYHPGTSAFNFEVNGFIIRPIICYDLRFPVWCRVEPAYDLLLCVANWPSPRINAWDTLLQARAIENQCFSVGVNRVGIDPNSNQYPGHSSVYDPLGRSMCFSQKEEVITVKIDKEQLLHVRQTLPYLADRDHFELK
ncbi:MAG: hypothetical protein RLZZ242_1354 [Bacteroidota bacterium]|jgi:predicted amidohydrolase